MSVLFLRTPGFGKGSPRGLRHAVLGISSAVQASGANTQRKADTQRKEQTTRSNFPTRLKPAAGKMPKPETKRRITSIFPTAHKSNVSVDKKFLAPLASPASTRHSISNQSIFFTVSDAKELHQV